MKKFLDSAADLVPDSVSGLAMAHPDLLQVNAKPLFVHRLEPKTNRVAIVSGQRPG